ncbi:extensin isoform X2 [Archocentrus centrarchus]|uniref:extensin isoform X2 n=1 Tax=Archocentrus centrarchus TaxID=63155 RepID=UPI0011EA310C|nr:extensin-like isoform X2 [Archocentrus centrarchus]
MDLRLHRNSQLQYGVNGGNSRPGDDHTVQFLSQEEQECIQFFENTIDSLEASLEEDDWRLVRARPIDSSIAPNEGVDRPRSMRANPGVTLSPHLARPPSSKDQDIIDLVHQDVDFVHTKEPSFRPTHPEFQSMMPPPERHFEIKPRHDPMDSLPSEYNPPLPSGAPRSTDSSYHPPGCIPTPVLIAQKMAENQPARTSNLFRHSSLESEKPPSLSTDHPVKQGPPTSAKPTRFPANINVIRGSKEHQNQSLPNVKIQERQAQMLANLGAGSSPTPLEAHNPVATDTGTKSPVHVTTPPLHVDRKPEVRRTPSSKSYEDRNPQPSLPPPAVTQSSYHPPPLENKASVPQPSEVSSLALNSYGGKSIVVNPSVASKGEPATSPTSHEPTSHPPALSNPSELNTYGGKSKVMTPAALAAPKNDLPDILSSHIDRRQTLPAKSEPPPPQPEPNNYGGKSRTINPITGLYRTADSPARSSKPPAPTTAPRPPRHSYHGITTPQKPASSLPTEHKRRSNSLFRPQGITVQFSGRGEMNESRREALRKLGLLKES